MEANSEECRNDFLDDDDDDSPFASVGTNTAGPVITPSPADARTACCWKLPDRPIVTLLGSASVVFVVFVASVVGASVTSIAGDGGVSVGGDGDGQSIGGTGSKPGGVVNCGYPGIGSPSKQLGDGVGSVTGGRSVGRAVCKKKKKRIQVVFRKTEQGVQM